MWNRLPLPPVEAVRFEIVGDALDPAAVTAALGLEPDYAEPPGPCPPEIVEMLGGLFAGMVPDDPVPPPEDRGGRDDDASPDELVLPGSWELSTRGRVAPGWLEPHLRYLLARLQPRRGALRAIAAGAELRLDVGFVATPDGELPAFEAVRAAPSAWAQAALAELGIGIHSLSMFGPPDGGAAWGDQAPGDR